MEQNKPNNPTTPGQPAQPNLYQLSGGGLHITYSSTSIEGKPHFQYHDTHGQASFAGDQVRTQESELGTLVTVYLMRTVDTGSTTLTVLLPRVNLGPSN